MALFTLGYAQFGLRPVVERIADSQFSAAAEKINASLDRLFDPVDTWLGVARKRALLQRFDENQPEAFNQLFKPVLQQLPQFTSIVAGTSNGLGWMLLEKPDGAWMNRFTDIPARNTMQLFVDWAADGSKQVRMEHADYDPRTHPWFMGAAGDINGGAGVVIPAGLAFYTALQPPDGNAGRVQCPHRAAGFQGWSAR